MKKIVLIVIVIMSLIAFVLIVIAITEPAPLRYALKFCVVDCKNNALQNSRINIYNVSYNYSFPDNLRNVLINAYYIHLGPYKGKKPPDIVYSKPLLSDLNGSVTVNISVSRSTPFVVVKIEKEGYYSVSYFIDFLEFRRSKDKENRYKIDESGNVILPVIDLHKIILKEINESDED